MPGFDGTVPNGMGSMTGGGRGFCVFRGPEAAYRPRAAYRTEWGFNPDVSRLTPDQELDFLKAQAQSLRAQLEQIEARLRQYDTANKTNS